MKTNRKAKLFGRVWGILFTLLILSSVLLIGCDDNTLGGQTGAVTEAVKTEGTNSLPPLTATERPPQTPAVTFPPPATGDGPAISYQPVEGQPQLKQIASLQAGDILSDVTCWDHFMMVTGYTLEGGENPDGDFPSEEVTSYVRIVDLRTGQTTAEYEYKNYVTAGFLENGFIYLYRQYPASVEVFDRTGAWTFRYASEEDEQVCIDRSGTGAVWCHGYESDRVRRIPLNGDAPQTFDLKGKIGYIQLVTEGCAYLSASDEYGTETVWRLLLDGSAENLPALRNFYAASDDAFYYDSKGHWRYLDAAQNPDRTVSFSITEEAYLISANRSRFLLQQSDGGAEDNKPAKLILCLPASNRQTELSLPTNAYLSAVCWQEDSIYLLVSQENGLFLYVWDYSEAPYTLLETSVHTLSASEKENRAVAEGLQKQWGITVYFEGEDMPKAASDYTASPLNDPGLIAQKLQALSDVLSAYPEGFFRELPYGDFDHLEIFICGRLTPNDSYGINTAIAISNTRGSALVIALDVTAIDSLGQTLAHELMHIMERRIDQVDASLLKNWTALTPGGDAAYYFSYHDENGLEMNDNSHTWMFEEDAEQVYFVDAYSKSFPGEDRARIFEYLVENGGQPAFLASPVLGKKAERLCEIIRSAFPSVAAAETVSWEK